MPERPALHTLIEDGAHRFSRDYDRPDAEVFQRSIAISNKRIADALEQIIMLMTPPVITGDALDGLNLSDMERPGIIRRAMKS